MFNKTVFLASLATYSSIYTVHNYYKDFLTASTKLGMRESSILDIFTILRFFSAYFFSYCADKRKCPALIAGICLLGQAITICTMYKIGDRQSFPMVIFFDIIYQIFNSGVIPCMETYVLNSSPNFSIMRLAGVSGKCVGNGLNLIALQLGYKDKIPVMVTLSAITTLITIPILFYAHYETKSLKTVENVKKEKRNLWSAIKEIVLSKYSIVLFFAMMQGVHRTAISNYQSFILDRLLPTGWSRWVFIFRAFPEIVLGLCTSEVEQWVGIFWMPVIGAIFGITKTIACVVYQPGDSGIIGKKDVETNLLCILYFFFLEILKGFFSCYMCYACTKITKYLNPGDLNTSAQGLYNGSFCACGAFISGVAGYVLLKDKKKQQQDVDTFKMFFIGTSLIGVVGLIPMIGLATRMGKRRI